MTYLPAWLRAEEGALGMDCISMGMGCLSMGMDCPRSSNLVVLNGAGWPKAFESLDKNVKLLRRTGPQFAIG